MRFHIVKRDNCPLWKKCCLYAGAVLLAVLLGAVLLMSLGVDPVAYYTRMFTMGTVGNRIAYKTYINYLLGNQLGFYYMAEAEAEGTVADFLKSYFE